MPSGVIGVIFVLRGVVMGEELVRDVYERLGRIEAKVDDVKGIRMTAENAEDIATKAYESSKSAHHRIDKIDKIIYWASTTIIGAIILALLGLVLKTN